MKTKVKQHIYTKNINVKFKIGIVHSILSQKVRIYATKITNLLNNITVKQRKC